MRPGAGPRASGVVGPTEGIGREMDRQLRPGRVLGWLLLGIVGLLFRLVVLVVAAGVLLTDVVLLWPEAPSTLWRVADGALFAAAVLVAWYVGFDAIGARLLARLIRRRSLSWGPGGGRPGRGPGNR
jgi:hypothetical protein